MQKNKKETLKLLFVDYDEKKVKVLNEALKDTPFLIIPIINRERPYIVDTYIEVKKFKKDVLF